MYFHLDGISPEERLTALAGDRPEIKSKREVATDLANLLPFVLRIGFLIWFGFLGHGVLGAGHDTD